MPIVLDEVRPNEVLVEMMYSGIYHTDLFPTTFGHEGAGVIRALGSDVKDKSLNIGDYVLLSFTTCGTCSACLDGQPASCHIHPKVNFSTVRLLDGRSVRSQFFGQSSLSRISVVSDHCVTGAGAVINILKPGKEHCVVIFGLGSVGFAALMAAAYLGVRQIVAIDIVDEKLLLAKDFGATHILNSAHCKDVVSRVKEITNGGADFALDCTGFPVVIETTIDCLAPGGSAASVGASPNTKIQIDPLAFLLRNKTYLGVIEGGSFIPILMELYKQGQFPIDKVCRVYSLKDIGKAISDLYAGTVIKPIIRWD
ncbi:hypothetical protein B0O99DRAFT_653761 [Bisporella sp. PMI_857]|nr:hypothetical protein B0O99DRAFT_653761 [Bisporella sp. PMI_857]